jgi:hypothetical protein
MHSGHARERACNGFCEGLTSRRNSQKSSCHAFEIRTYDLLPYSNIFGDSNPQNLVAPHRRVLLLTGVAAGDEHIATGISDCQTMQAEAIVSLHQNDISPAEVRLIGGLYVDCVSIANCRRHTGAARLKANAKSDLQAFQAEGFELPGLRPVFALAHWALAHLARVHLAGANLTGAIVCRSRAVNTHDVSTRKISHGN